MDIANDSLGDLFSFAASILFVFDLYFSRVSRFTAHWRTLPLMVVNFMSSWVYVCLGISQAIQNCPIDAWRKPFFDCLHTVISLSAKLYNTWYLHNIMLPLSLVTAIIVALFPVPSMPVLNGIYKRVGTASFAIPITLSGKESQIYKGAGVHVGGNPESMDTETYHIPIQCWFPIIVEETLVEKVVRSLGFNYAGAALWSSGHPKHQDFEAEHLLKCIAKIGNLPSILLSHLALAKSNAQHFNSLENIFGLKKGEALAEEHLNAYNLKNVTDIRSRPASTDSVPWSAMDNERLLSPVKRLVSSNSPLKDLPLFPVAIYSHGKYSWRQIGTTTFEKLAAQGFVVFAMDHIPSCMSSRDIELNSLLSNQSINRPQSCFDYDYDLPANIPPGSIEEREFYAGGMDRRVREMQCLINFLCMPHDGRGSLVDGYSSEDSFDVNKESDYLANTWDSVSNAGDGEGNADEIKGVDKSFVSLGKALFHVDIDKICVLGHSFGGGTCVSAVCRDKRIRAVCALDSWLYPAKDAYSTDPRFTGFEADFLNRDVQQNSTQSDEKNSVEVQTANQRPQAELVAEANSPNTADKPNNLVLPLLKENEDGQYQPVQSASTIKQLEKEWFERNSDAEDFFESSDSETSDDGEDGSDSSDNEEQPLPVWAQSANSKDASLDPSPSSPNSRKRVSVLITLGEAVSIDPRAVVKERRRSHVKEEISTVLVNNAAAGDQKVASPTVGAPNPVQLAPVQEHVLNKSTSESTLLISPKYQQAKWRSTQSHLASASGPKVLFLSAEQWSFAPFQALYREAFAKKCHPNNIFRLVVLDTNHQNFCDLHLLARTGLMRGGDRLGPADPFVHMDAMNEIISHFFEQTCKRSLHDNTVVDSDAEASDQVESDSKRLLGFLRGDSFSRNVSRNSSSGSLASVDDDNFRNVINQSNSGLAILSRLKHLSLQAVVYISSKFRDETSDAKYINRKYAHLCDPELQIGGKGI